MRDIRNVDELRSGIDSGQTGDKMPWPDPAAAPLGMMMKREVHPPRALRSPWHTVRKRAGQYLRDRQSDAAWA
jgi:hypothetical protein